MARAKKKASANENESKETKSKKAAEEEIINEAEKLIDEESNPEDVQDQPAAEPLSEEEETFKLQLKRVQAEFINFKNRTTKEKQEIGVYVKSEFTKRFLPVLDDLQRLNEHLEADHDKLKEAISMVLGKLDKFLENEKISPIAAKGDEFDPNFHEALMQQPVEDEKDDNKIMNIFEQGYKMEEKVIRFAKVQVGAKS